LKKYGNKEGLVESPVGLALKFTVIDYALLSRCQFYIVTENVQNLWNHNFETELLKQDLMDIDYNNYTGYAAQSMSFYSCLIFTVAWYSIFPYYYIYVYICKGCALFSTEMASELAQKNVFVEEKLTKSCVK